MKQEIEWTYREELAKVREEDGRQHKQNVEVVRLEVEQKFVDELRKV